MISLFIPCDFIGGRQYCFEFRGRKKDWSQGYLEKLLDNAIKQMSKIRFNRNVLGSVFGGWIG